MDLEEEGGGSCNPSKLGDHLFNLVLFNFDFASGKGANSIRGFHFEFVTTVFTFVYFILIFAPRPLPLTPLCVSPPQISRKIEKLSCVNSNNRAPMQDFYNPGLYQIIILPPPLLTLNS